MPKMPQRLGDGPIEQKYIDQMNVLAGLIDEFFNGTAKGNARKVGFCLMMFEFGSAPGRCNYISNAERADVVTLLKEQLARFEGQPEMTGRA